MHSSGLMVYVSKALQRLERQVLSLTCSIYSSWKLSMVDNTGFGEVCPNPQRAVSLITRPNVESISRSFSFPFPSVILFNISSRRLFPMRHGVHLPHDSSTVKSR